MAATPPPEALATAVVATALGDFTVTVASGAVVEVLLPGTPKAPAPSGADALLDRAAEAIEAVVSGHDPGELPLQLEGTAFQLAVWRALREVPAGQVVTYGELARRAGYPRAARAVGSAMHANPLPILIPCHRVVASNGIGGYGGGLALKRALLAAEGVEVG